MKRILIASCVLSACLASSRARAEMETYHEVGPSIAFYSGDALRNFTIGGFQYTYHFTRLFWIGADFLGGTLSVDEPNGLDLKSGQKFIAVDGAVYFNIPALLGASKMKGESGMSADLYTSVGGGNFWIGSRREPYGFVGGGMLLHTGLTWLAFRFDLKGYFYRLPNRDGGDFNSDMSLNIGPSLTF